jgi:hypothetical protein
MERKEIPDSECGHVCIVPRLLELFPIRWLFINSLVRFDIHITYYIPLSVDSTLEQNRFSDTKFLCSVDNRLLYPLTDVLRGFPMGIKFHLPPSAKADLNIAYCMHKPGEPS